MSPGGCRALIVVAAGSAVVYLVIGVAVWWWWPVITSWLVAIAQNLAASLIWGVPAFAHLHMRLNRDHDELTANIPERVRRRAGVRPVPGRAQHDEPGSR